MKLALVLLLAASPALAEVSGIVRSADGAVIELHSATAAPCLEPAKTAVYVSGTRRIGGCWVMRRGMVIINWFDGDHDEFHRSLVKVPERS